jgi:hypothetical protein
MKAMGYKSLPKLALEQLGLGLRVEPTLCDEQQGRWAAALQHPKSYRQIACMADLYRTRAGWIGTNQIHAWLVLVGAIVGGKPLIPKNVRE